MTLSNQQQHEAGFHLIREAIACGTRTLWIAEDWDTAAFRQFLHTLHDSPAVGTTIYHERNRLDAVDADPTHGIPHPILIKRFSMARRYDQLRFHLLDSKALRSLRIAQAMLRLGVNTPRPLAVIDERSRMNRLLHSTLITEYLPHAFAMLRFTAVHPLWPKIRPYLPTIARDLRKLHDAGIQHNDFHGGNMLVSESEDGYSFSYIDLNRARIRTSLSLAERMKDVARFALTGDDRQVFLDAYWPEGAGSLLALYEKTQQRRERRKALQRLFAGVQRP